MRASHCLVIQLFMSYNVHVCMSIFVQQCCWFCYGTMVSSANKTDCRNVTLSLIVLIITNNPKSYNAVLFRWLLRDTEMQVRSNYGPYQEAVERFFSQLIPQVADLQVYLTTKLYGFVFHFQIIVSLYLFNQHPILKQQFIKYSQTCPCGQLY